VTKHADVEVSGQTGKTCLIKHRIKLQTQRTMGHKLPSVPYATRNFNMAECETKLKLKKSMAAYIRGGWKKRK